VGHHAGRTRRCDVVAWHGNLRPAVYDLARFNAIGTVSFDHPDPSHLHRADQRRRDTPGRANCDFVIFPPRWMVAEDTFRPPWFHRNIMNECMGLIRGVYDAKAEGFAARRRQPARPDERPRPRPRHHRTRHRRQPRSRTRSTAPWPSCSKPARSCSPQPLRHDGRPAAIRL
jgi:hypothetical protein